MSNMAPLQCEALASPSRVPLCRLREAIEKESEAETLPAEGHLVMAAWRCLRGDGEGQQQQVRPFA